MATPPRDLREWMRAVERKLTQAIRTGNSAAVTALNAEADAIREEIVAGAHDARTPAAPVEFTVQSSLHVDSNGRTYGRIFLDFSAVTKATDATNLDVDYYELWGRDETTWDGTPETAPEYKLIDTASTSHFYSQPFDPASTWRFKVRAIGVTTIIPGLWSVDSLVTVLADTTPPPIPSAPVLTQQYSVITVAWDGFSAAGGAQPADFAHTEVAVGSASSPTTIHSLFGGAGSLVIAGLPQGAPTYVRLRAVDNSGNKSAWGAQRQITPKALVSGDISGLDVTLADQIARSEAAEAAALQSAAEAEQAAIDAAASQAAATAAQGEADTAAAEAAASAASAATANSEAAAARAAADQAEADAAAAQVQATQAAADAEQALADLQYNMESAGRIIRQEDAPTGDDANSNNLWIKDSTGESFTWDTVNLVWELVDNATYAAAAAAADAAADRAEAAEAAAVQAEADATAAEAAATSAAATATTAQQNAAAAQTAATTAQSEAADSAAAAAASQSAAEAAEQTAIAADAKADTAEANALAAVGIAEAKGKVYAQPEAPANDPNGMWIDTDAGNAVRVLTKKRALYKSDGGGSNAGARFAAVSAGWEVTTTTEVLTLAMLEGYDALLVDSGYAGVSTNSRTVAAQAFEAGYSVFTTGNDTTAMAPLFTGTGSRGTEKNNPTRPVGTHPIVDGSWTDYVDSDANLYLTGVNAAATVLAVTAVAGVDQPMAVAMEHATNTARWVHIETYAAPTPLNFTIAAADWLASRWRFVQDQAVLDAAAEAVAAREAADAAEAAATTAEANALAAQGEAAASAATAADAETAAAAALADATAAQNAAVAAQQAADAAEARADAAEAAAAQSAADANQSMTDLQAYLGTSGRLIYEEAEPTGDDRNKNNLWIKPSDGTSYTFDPAANAGAGAWVEVVNEVVAQAALDADAAADAAAASQTAAADSAAAAAAAEAAATAAESNADALTASAQQAAADASAAEARATAAETAAAQAEADAAASLSNVQTLMETSGRIIYQDETPAVEDQNANNLWIKDSTGEAFAWDDIQDAWVLVQSSTVTDAALAADAAADRAEAAEAAAEAARTDATNARTDATNAQAAAVAAQNEAAAAEQRAADAEAAAAASAADAQSAQAAADQSFNDLQGFLDDAGKIMRQEAEPAVEDRNPNNLWIKDSTGEPYTWVPTANGGAGAWVIVTDQRVVEMAAAADAAADAAELAEADAAAAQAAAIAAQGEAATSAGSASTAQQAADAAAAAANQSQAEADAAAAAAAASAADAAQSATDADAAAQAAGSSSAAALVAQEAAEAANEAADAAVATADAAMNAAVNVVRDPGFEQGYWATQNLPARYTFDTVQKRTGTTSLKVAGATGTGAVLVAENIPVSSGDTWRGEVWVRTDANYNGTPSWGKFRISANGGTIFTNAVTFPHSLDTWTKVAIEQYIQPGWKDITVQLGSDHTTGTIWFDDVSVTNYTSIKAALAAAQAAQNTANTANSNAGSAQDTADAALSAATHSGKAFFSADPPSGTAPLNSTWQQYDVDGRIIGSWQQTAGDAETDGGTWTKRQLTSAQFDNFDAGKITFGTMSGARIQAGTLVISSSEVPDLSADKITSGTLPQAVTVPGGSVSGAVATATTATSAGTATNATNVTGSIGAGVAVPGGQVSGTVPVAAVPALPTSRITNLDTNLATLDAAAQTAMLATAYSKNPSFDKWTGTYPDDYTSWGAVVPTKDTVAKRVGSWGANFNVTASGTQAGLTLGATFNHMPNVQYVTVEVEFMLKSGTLAGSGVLIDWSGMANNRATIKFADEVPSPTLNKWHRLTTTVARPSNATGTWTGMAGFLMANYTSIGAAVKSLTFDWFNVRPATEQEIDALLAKQKTDQWAAGDGKVAGGQVSGTVPSATTAGSATNATNVTGTIGAGVSVPGSQVSGTVPVAAVPAIPIDRVTDLNGKITLYDANGTLLNSWKKTGTTYIDGGQLFTDSVTALAIAANAIEADHILAGAIEAEKLETQLVLTTSIIAGDPLGTHAVMDENGFRVFSADPADGIPNEVVRMGVAATDDYFAISKADGTLAATISQDGVGSFAEVNANDELYYKGERLSTVLGRLPRGPLYKAELSADIDNITTEYGLVEGEYTTDGEDRQIEIELGIKFYPNQAGDEAYVAVRYTADGSAPTINSQRIFEAPLGLISSTSYDSKSFKHTIRPWTFVPNYTSGQRLRFLMTVKRGNGASLRVRQGLFTYMYINDVGPGIAHSPSFTPGGGSNPAPPPPVPAKQNYVRQYGTTMNANYDGNNNRYTFNDNVVFQGLSPAGYGNLKGLCNFDRNAITADLSGADVQYVRVYFNFQHWYYNSGGTARIGVHGHTGIPGTFSSVGPLSAISGSWPKPGARWVDLSSSHWSGFKSGGYCGVYLEGDGTYGTYGYADRPTLEIGFAK